MLSKNYLNQSKILALLVVNLSIVAMGCGSAPTQGIVAPAVNQTINTLPTYIPNPIVVTTPTNLNDAYNYSFQLQETSMSCNQGGNPTPAGVSVGSYTTAGISTDNIFKITVSSGSYTTIPCTGYTAVYSCLQYTITVGARSETVKVSFGNPQSGPCAGIPSSKTLDFSDQAGPGHGPLTVRVSQPQSDNCRTSGYPNSGGCAMSPLYSNYIGAGTLAVTTNNPN